jgi:UDP-N-acetyl-D-galactosamine dehydrogenase
MNLKKHSIALVGLGYLGLPLAVEFGKNRPVTGFGITVERTAELRTGRYKLFEGL